MGTRKSPVLPWVDPELRRVELARLAPGELALRCLSQIDRLAEAHLGTAARREERWCARLDAQQRELQALAVQAGASERQRAEQASTLQAQAARIEALSQEQRALQAELQAAQQQMQEAAKHATGLRAALLPAALREQLLAWKARLP